MESLSAQDITLLMESRDRLCVSLYVSTPGGPTQSSGNRIRWKNALDQAQSMLGQMADPARDAVQRRLQEAQRILDEAAARTARGESVAVFVSEGVLRTFQLPLALENFVTVSGRFHVKPLLPLLTAPAGFYILAVSLNKSRLLRCTPGNVHELDLPSLPQGISGALPYDEYEKQLQYHSGTPGRPGNRSAVFHGHGVGHDDRKNRILRYFRELDKSLETVLTGAREPLVLACVDYLVPLYRQANSYPHLLDAALPGNPDELSAQQLREAAAAVIEPHARQARAQAVLRYRNALGSDRSSDDLRIILPAAHEGRVDTLFVDVAAHLWGRFDWKRNQLSLQDRNAPGRDDLLDLAAAQTLLKGGTVYALEAAEMPSSSPLAALLRYEG